MNGTCGRDVGVQIIHMIINIHSFPTDLGCKTGGADYTWGSTVYIYNHAQ